MRSEAVVVVVAVIFFGIRRVVSSAFSFALLFVVYLHVTGDVCGI